MDSRSGNGAIVRSLGLTSEWDLSYMDLYRSKYHLFVAPTNLMCSCLIRRGRGGMTAHRQFLDIEARLVDGAPEVAFRWLTDHQVPKEDLMPEARQFFLRGTRIDECELISLDERMQEETAMLADNLPGTAAVALRYAVVKNKNPQFFINEPAVWVPRALGTVDPSHSDDYDNTQLQLEGMLLSCICGQGTPYSYVSRSIQNMFHAWFKASPMKVYRAMACSFEALYGTLEKIPGAIHALTNLAREIHMTPHSHLGCGEEDMLRRWMIPGDYARFKDCVPWWAIHPRNWERINNDNSFVFGRRVDITSAKSDAILCLAGMGYDIDYVKVAVNAIPAGAPPQKLPPVDLVIESKPEADPASIH